MQADSPPADQQSPTSVKSSKLAPSTSPMPRRRDSVSRRNSPATSPPQPRRSPATSRRPARPRLVHAIGAARTAFTRNLWTLRDLTCGGARSRCKPARSSDARRGMAPPAAAAAAVVVAARRPAAPPASSSFNTVWKRRGSGRVGDGTEEAAEEAAAAAAAAAAPPPAPPAPAAAAAGGVVAAPAAALPAHPRRPDPLAREASAARSGDPEAGGDDGGLDG